MAGHSGFHSFLRGLVLVLPLVTFVAEHTDAVENLGSWEDRQELIAVNEGVGSDYTTIPGLRVPGVEVEDAKEDVANCQEFCSARKHCFAFTFDTQEKTCSWSSHPLNYDSSFNLYVPKESGDVGFVEFPGIKQLDDPLASASLTDSRMKCENSCRDDSSCHSYSYSKHEQKCFKSSLGLVFDLTAVYYEKDSPRALDRISATLQTDRDKAEEFHNEKHAKDKKAASMRELEEKAEKERQIRAEQEKEKAAKAAVVARRKAEAEEKEKAKAAAAAQRKEEAAKEKEKKQEHLKGWLNAKAKAADDYNEAVKLKEAQADFVVKLADQLEVQTRKVKDLSQAASVAVNVAKASATGGALAYVKSLASDKVIPPMTEQDAESKVATTKLKENSISIRLSSVKTALDNAVRGIKSQKLQALEKQQVELSHEVERRKVASKIAPNPTLTTEILDYSKKLAQVEAQIASEKAANEPSRLELEQAQLHTELTSAEAARKAAVMTLEQVRNLPILPPGPKGISATVNDNNPKFVKAGEEATQELVKAGAQAERSTNKVLSALGDLAEGKGELAEEELPEAKTEATQAEKDLEATQDNVMRTNPASVMDQKAETAQKVKEGIPPVLAAAIARQDALKAEVVTAQKKLEDLSHKLIKAKEVMEVSSAYSQHEKYVERESKKETQTKKDERMKELADKGAAEKAQKVQEAKQAELDQKKAEAEHREALMKETAAKKDHAEKAKQEKSEKDKERMMTPAAAKAESDRQKTTVTLEKMQAKEIKAKMHAALEGIKAHNHDPAKRAPYETKFNQLKPLLSEKELDLAMAHKKAHDAARNIRLAREKSEKKSAEIAQKAQVQDELLRKQSTAAELQNKNAADKARAAEEALERQIAAAAAAPSAEAREKLQLKVKETKAKLEQQQHESETQQAKFKLLVEKKTKSEAKVEENRKREVEIKERNKREAKEQADKAKTFQENEKRRAEKASEMKSKIETRKQKMKLAFLEKKSKTRIKKELQHKKIALADVSKNGQAAYSHFADNYGKKIEVAADHEASEKYKIARPMKKEADHKAELAKKKEAQERTLKVKAKAQKEEAEKKVEEANDKAVSKEKLGKESAKAAEVSSKKEVADKAVERNSKAEEGAEKAKEGAEKTKEGATKSQSAAKKEAAEKKTQEARTKKKESEEKLEVAKKAKEAVEAKKLAEHQKLLALASGFPKSRVQSLKFSSLGSHVSIAPMAPKSRARIAKVGDVCMAEGVVRTPTNSDTTQAVLAKLPESCWPNRRLVFHQGKLEEGSAVQSVRVDVLVTGEIIAVTNNEPGSVISMDGITFSPQGSEALTESQERLCKGWKAPPPAPPAPLPEPPVGKLNWISRGCWLDGGGTKMGATEMLQLGEDLNDQQTTCRRRRMEKKDVECREKQDKAAAKKKEAAQKAQTKEASEKEEAEQASKAKQEKSTKLKETEIKEGHKKKQEELKIKQERAQKTKKENDDKEVKRKVQAERDQKRQEQNAKEKAKKAADRRAREAAVKRKLSQPALTSASKLGYDNRKYASKADPIRQCAAFAARKNIPFFSIQNGGYCSLQTNPNQNYEKYGAAKTCIQGEGGPTAADVYEVLEHEGPEEKPSAQENAEIDGFGCFDFSAKSEKIKPVELRKKSRFALEAPDPSKNNNTDPVKECSQYAAKHKFKFFAVGVKDQCFTGQNYENSFRQEEPSFKCKDGRGGVTAQNVYRIENRTKYDWTTADNVALGRPTSQSSVAQRSPSWFAVDGNTSNCALTQIPDKGKINVLKIALEKSTHVQAVHIYTGTAGFDNLAVHVSETSFYQNTPSCGLTHSFEAKSNKVVNCELTGKYVFVVNMDASPLNICEVKVWANAAPLKKPPPPPPPPPPMKPREFGARRRSLATSYRPKGKKMLTLTKLDLKNKWRSLGSGYGNAYTKTQGFMCMVSGVITGPAYGVLAQLPEMCRPKKNLIFGLNSHWGQMKVTVDTAGQVSCGGGENKWLSLNGLTFSVSSYHRKIDLKNGWLNFDEKRYPYANFVVENRMCVLGGLIFAGQFDVVGVLSPECRPLNSKVFNAPTGADLDKLARINIYPDGRIVWTGGQQEEAFLSLNGITFPCQRDSRTELGEATQDDVDLMVEDL